MEDIEEEIKDMTPKLLRDLGMRKATETSPQRYRFGLYECQYCGREFECITNSVNTGKTKSCGCFATHGLSSNKFYQTWYNMLQRCNNLESINYKDYGARGITVCEEWLDVRNFIAWCDLTYPNIEGMSLDRIDNDKGYSPDNCRWADKTTQVINQRIMKNNTSGYVGVSWHIRNKKWTASIRFKNEKINLGSFKDKIEAVQARDNYIIENNLPHKLSILNTGL